MTFTITYRDKTGARREEALEAADRASCVAACRARGISPLAIREGLKGLKGDKGDKSLKGDKGDKGNRVDRGVNGLKALNGLKGLVSLMAVAILAAGGLWWWLGGRGAPAKPAPDAPARPRTVPERRPAAPLPKATAPGPASVASPAPARTASPSLYPTNEHSIALDRPVVRFEAKTNAAGRVVEHIWTDDGKLHTNIYSTKPPVFESGTDELLALAVQTRPGEMPPPPPPVDPADEKLFLESLKKPIAISESDPPEVRAVKERVIQARKDMAAMLAEGRSFADVLAENRKLQEENAAARQGVVESLKKILAEGDMETARKFVEESNMVLEQMGVMPVAIPAAAGGESVPKGDLMRTRKKENRQ